MSGERGERPEPPGGGEPHRRWRLSRGELAAIAGFWALLALLSAANRVLDPRGPGPHAALPTAPLLLALFESALWALLTPLVFWLSSRASAEQARQVQRLLLLLAVGVLLAVCVDVASAALRAQLIPPLRRFPARVSPLESVRRLWFLNDLIVYLAVLAAGFAREYFRRYRSRQEEAVRLQAHAAQLQAQLAQARLQALRMQLDPHFLFNTLHAVSSLVERDPRGVRRMISRLSELLRYTLDGAREPEVPVEREFDFLGRYLEIMQIRFQGRLEVELHAAPEVRDALLPNLILQPLVENAIKHGVSKLERVGQVEVSAAREGERLVLRVRDNGAGLEADGAARDAEGVGLRNVRERLRELYGDDQQLVLRPAQGGGALAEIRLPFHTAADLRAALAPRS